MSFHSDLSFLATRRWLLVNQPHQGWIGLTPHFKAMGLAVVLATTLGLCLMPEIIAPPVAQAYTARVTVSIDRQKGESYDALLRRAELVARAAAQRGFDRDILINDVAIVIIAQNSGVEVPILTLDVSRQQWRSRPDSRAWATYYKTAKTLLGLDNVTTPGSFVITAPATPRNQLNPQRQTPSTSTPQPLPLPGATSPNSPAKVTPASPSNTPPVQSSPSDSNTPKNEDEDEEDDL